MRVSAAGIPVDCSSAMARARACAALMFRCARIVSTIWRPIVYSGFSEVSGSWKIAPISRPRTLRISSGGRLSMRRPFSLISPAAIRPGGSSRPMIAAPVIDLPAPDSPTTPSTSPGAIENDTSSIAVRMPRRVGNSTRSLLTSRSGDLLTSAQLRVEGIPKPVAEQVHRHAQKDQCRAGKDHQPPLARVQEVVAVVDHRAQ